MNTNMKPFDLQGALAGKPVVTRDGRHVNQIAHFPSAETYPVMALVEGSNEVESFTLSGEYIGSDEGESSWDLFMETPTKKVWCNVYPSGLTNIQPYKLGAYAYDSEERAPTNKMSDAVATVSFEVEQ